ncbi:MAG: phage portal protein [Magnetococcus sp. YQC-5]
MDDFWFSPVGVRSASGTLVTPEAALRLSACYACVRILAETIASMPIVVYRRRADGGKDRIVDHWLYHLLAVRPNQYQTSFEWREMMMGHLGLRGNAYNQIVSDYRGRVTDLIPVHPDKIAMEVLTSGDYRYRVTMLDGNQQIMNRGDIWHIRGLSSDGYMGLSPISMARETFGAALATQEYSGRFFKNDARPTSGWLKFPGQLKDVEARENLRAQMQRHLSGSNQGKVLILDNGMEYNAIGVSNKDAQFLELRQFQVTEIARLFRIPPHMIGDLSKATFSNIEHQGLDFVKHTMTPWTERWEASIEREFVPDGEALEVEFDFFGLLRGDTPSRSAYYQSGIAAGWLTCNEARIAEGMNPLPGLDEPLRALNMAPAGTPKPKNGNQPDVAHEADPVHAEQILSEPEPVQVEAAEPEDPETKEPNHLNVIAARVAERIARKEVMAVRKAISQGKTMKDAIQQAYQTHGRYVSESMAVSQGAAEAYCDEMKAFLESGGESAIAWMEEKSMKELSRLGGFTHE